MLQLHVDSQVIRNKSSIKSTYQHVQVQNNVKIHVNSITCKNFLENCKFHTLNWYRRDVLDELYTLVKFQEDSLIFTIKSWSLSEKIYEFDPKS